MNRFGYPDAMKFVASMFVAGIYTCTLISGLGCSSAAGDDDSAVGDDDIADADDATGADAASVNVCHSETKHEESFPVPLRRRMTCRAVGKCGNINPFLR